MTNLSGNSYSYFTDGNGNVVDLTDAYGNSAAHYEYDPFGNLAAQTGTLQQNYQWSSKETDAGTGLVYYGFRFYNPTLGRWSNRDPLNEAGGLNLTEYAYPVDSRSVIFS
jgi:RHS repeat-associated protein